MTDPQPDPDDTDDELSRALGNALRRRKKRTAIATAIAAALYGETAPPDDAPIPTAVALNDDPKLKAIALGAITPKED